MQSEPRPSNQEISIQIPSPDAGTFSSRVVPGKDGPPGAKPAAEPQAVKPAEEGSANTAAAEGGVLQSEQEKVLAPADTKSVPAKDKTSAAKDAKAPAAETRKKATEARETSSDGRFVVQITALADAAKAESLQKSLAAKGIKSYTEVVKTNSGEVTRVRIGPFASRETAEQERAKLKSLGFEGNVAPR